MSLSIAQALRLALRVARILLPASVRAAFMRAAWGYPFASYLLHYPAWKEYVARWADLARTGLHAHGAAAKRSGTISLTYGLGGERLSGGNDLGSFWWLDPRSPHAYQFASLDDVYPAPYFERDAHPAPEQANEIYAWMQTEYASLVGRPFQSVLELGAGGGHLTTVFRDHHLDYITVEGTTDGCSRLRALGIPNDRIVRADLRSWQGVDRHFDLVMCTEVVEHLELPLSGNAVLQACRHADYVWFSSPTPPETDGPKHLTAAGDYEHPCCLPIACWDNLFAFLGLNAFVRLDPSRPIRRGMRLYYRSVQ